MRGGIGSHSLGCNTNILSSNICSHFPFSLFPFPFSLFCVLACIVRNALSGRRQTSHRLLTRLLPVLLSPSAPQLLSSSAPHRSPLQVKLPSLCVNPHDKSPWETERIDGRPSYRSFDGPCQNPDSGIRNLAPCVGEVCRANSRGRHTKLSPRRNHLRGVGSRCSLPGSRSLAACRGVSPCISPTLSCGWCGSSRGAGEKCIRKHSLAACPVLRTVRRKLYLRGKRNPETVCLSVVEGGAVLQ